MRNALLISIYLVLLFAQFGCSDTPVNGTEANSQVDANGNPIPVIADITDAGMALAEGNRLFDIGETEKAIEAFQKSVELDPNAAEAHFKMGIAFSLIEMRDAVNVEETPTPLPGEEKPKEIRSNSDKAFEKAVEAYKKVIDEDPKNDIAHFNLGRAYAKLDEDQDAAKALRQAAKLKPEDTEYQTELGSMLIRLAKYDEAVAALRKAVELDPSNSQAEELLERAEAGRKRINYTTLPRDPKKADEKDDADTENSNTEPEKSTENGKTAPPKRQPIETPPTVKTPKKP